MKIELHKITVRELVEGYVDDAESGVRGFEGTGDMDLSGNALPAASE